MNKQELELKLPMNINEVQRKDLLNWEVMTDDLKWNFLALICLKLKIWVSMGMWRRCTVQINFPSG